MAASFAWSHLRAPALFAACTATSTGPNLTPLRRVASGTQTVAQSKGGVWLTEGMAAAGPTQESIALEAFDAASFADYADNMPARCVF